MLHSHSSAYDSSAVCNSMYVRATGAGKEELEASAFQQAREFFGGRSALEFTYPYRARKLSDGEGYYTEAVIREVNPRPRQRARRHRHFHLHFCL